MDVPAVCREAIRAVLNGQPAGEHQHQAHEHPGTNRQLRALTAAVAVAGAVAFLALVVAAVALRTD